MKTLIFFILIIAGVTMFMLHLLKGLKQFLFTQNRSRNSSSFRNARNNTNYAGEQHKKIFSKNEGEYVKYEEMKD